MWWFVVVGSRSTMVGVLYEALVGLKGAQTMQQRRG